MPTTTLFRSAPYRLLLTAVASLAIALGAASADAQSRGGGGKPSMGHGGGKPGWSGGGGGRGWNGGGNWHGGNQGNWHRGNHGNWHGHGSHWRGHYYPYWRGYYGGRYYYPGWAVGLGVGIGLTYPWWGWYPSYAYPATTVVYERVYDAPVGVVVERDGPVTSPAPSGAPAPAPAYRWYCPSPAGYHPDVGECAAGWLKVVPDGGPPPPAGVPRSSAPADEVERADRIAPGTMGSTSTSRIAAPRMAAPSQLAQRAPPAETFAQAHTK